MDVLPSSNIIHQFFLLTPSKLITLRNILFKHVSVQLFSFNIQEKIEFNFKLLIPNNIVLSD